MNAGIMIGLFLGLMFAGFPIAYSMALSAVVALAIEGQVPLLLLAQQFYAALDNFSLLAIPLLGYAHYDDAVYKNTRERILSSKNEWYFSGSVLAGLGSPHTPRGFVWPLAVMVGALTTDDAAVKADAFRMLLRSQCGNGLMHESVAVDNGAACTRDWFEWANAMYVTLYEDTFRERCDGAADAHRLVTVGQREGAAADPLHYETLEAQVQFLAA